MSINSHYTLITKSKQLVTDKKKILKGLYKPRKMVKIQIYTNIQRNVFIEKQTSDLICIYNTLEK